MEVSSEDLQILNLVQAMIGSITPNFRRVTMETAGPTSIRLCFLLEQDESADREEIDEIAFEFEALQDANIDTEIVVVVDPRPLEQVALTGRVVYGRREEGTRPHTSDASCQPPGPIRR